MCIDEHINIYKKSSPHYTYLHTMYVNERDFGIGTPKICFRKIGQSHRPCLCVCVMNKNQIKFE